MLLSGDLCLVPKIGPSIALTAIPELSILRARSYVHIESMYRRMPVCSISAMANVPMAGNPSYAADLRSISIFLHMSFLLRRQKLVIMIR